MLDYLEIMAANRSGGATHAAERRKKTKKARRPAQKKMSQRARKGLTRKKNGASMRLSSAAKRARSKSTAHTAEVTSMARKKKSAKRYGRFSAKEEEAKSKKKKAKRGGKKTKATKKKRAKSSKKKTSRKSRKKTKAKAPKKKRAKASKKKKRAKSTSRKSRKGGKKKRAKARKKPKARKKKRAKSTKKKRAKSRKKSTSRKAARKGGKKKRAKSKGGKRRASKQQMAVVRVPGKTQIIRVAGKTEVIRVPVRAAEGTTRRKPKSSKRKGARRGSMPVVYSGGVMENPLSGVEWVAVVFTGIAGFGTMDIIDRLIATHKLGPSANPNAPAGTYGDTPPKNGDYQGLYNATAILAPMNKWRYFAGLGVTLAPIGLAHLSYFDKHPVGRSAFQIFGIGAGLRFVGKAFQDFMAWALRKTKFGQQVYDAEMRAAAARKTKGDINAADFPWLPTTGLGASEEAPQEQTPIGAGAPANGYPGGTPAATGAGAPCGTCINCRTGVGNCACPCQAGGGGGGTTRSGGGPSMNPPSGSPSNPSGPSGTPSNPTACPPGMARNADGVCVQVIAKAPPGPAAMNTLAGVPRPRRGVGAPQQGSVKPRFGLYRHTLPKDAA